MRWRSIATPCRSAADAIGIYGTSAGAVLTLQLLARIKAEGLPMPAAAGFFSGSGDLALVSDCEAYLPSIMGSRTAPNAGDYCAGTDRPIPCCRRSMATCRACRRCC
jgi:monoterpene epsilon-lactone hydrolase